MKMNPLIYKVSLGRVVHYLESQGYEVKLNSNSFGFFEEDALITAPTKAHGTDSMIIGLLHEAGHTVQPRSQFNDMHKSLKRDKAIIIEQEYSAWVYGWTIAEELHIDTPVLEQAYKQSWLKYWTQYIEYIGKDWSKSDIHHLAESYIES